MSHTSTISAVKILSVSALRAAVDELNASGVRCSLTEGGKPRAYYDNQQGLGEADFVLQLPGANYDVGLYKSEDGSYEARTDFWGGSVAACLGAAPSKPENAEQAKLGRLFQLYAIHATTEQAVRKGLTVRRTAGENGKIKLVLTGAGL